MEIETFDLKKKYQDVINIDGNINNTYNSIIKSKVNTKVKTNLLNIDSDYRTKKSKHIVELIPNFLPVDPIETVLNLTELKINYPKHKLREGDYVVIEGVVGESINTNRLYLIHGTPLLVIEFTNHGILTNYKNFSDSLYLKITILDSIENTSIITNKLYQNIELNMLDGIKKIYLWSDIREEMKENDILSSQVREFLTFLDNIDTNYEKKLEIDFLFVELDHNFIYNNSESFIYQVPHIYKIDLLDINGVPISYINSNYPVNENHKKDSYIISKTDEDNIYIYTIKKAYKSGKRGGGSVKILKILKSISGYPDANEFNLDIKSSYKNIFKIELVSSEFPYIDFLINKNKNDKLYWQLFSEGSKIYSIQIPPGNYSSNKLVEIIQGSMNKVKRIPDENNFIRDNIFNVILNMNTQEIIFNAFESKNMPESIKVDTLTREDRKVITYLSITLKNNILEIGDEITITNSNSIGNVPKEIINRSHKIAAIDKASETYHLELPNFIPLKNILNSNNGGSSVNITYPIKFRLLFNYSDTIGEIINFKNPGNSKSITKFKKKYQILINIKIL